MYEVTGWECNVGKKRCKDWGGKRSYEIVILESGKAGEAVEQWTVMLSTHVWFEIMIFKMKTVISQFVIHLFFPPQMFSSWSAGKKT